MYFSLYLLIEVFQHYFVGRYFGCYQHLEKRCQFVVAPLVYHYPDFLLPIDFVLVHYFEQLRFLMCLPYFDYYHHYSIIVVIDLRYFVSVGYFHFAIVAHFDHCNLDGLNLYRIIFYFDYSALYITNFH